MLKNAVEKQDLDGLRMNPDHLIDIANFGLFLYYVLEANDVKLQRNGDDVQRYAQIFGRDPF